MVALFRILFCLTCIVSFVFEKEQMYLGLIQLHFFPCINLKHCFTYWSVLSIKSLKAFTFIHNIKAMAIKWTIVYSASGEQCQYSLFDDRENLLFQNPTMVITFATVFFYIKKIGWGEHCCFLFLDVRFLGMKLWSNLLHVSWLLLRLNK